MKLQLKSQSTIINAQLRLTGSKSETNRMLLLQALYPNIVLINTSKSDDSEVMLRALQFQDNDKPQIIDVHHAGHPDTKNSLGKNGISFGFTGHYRAMRERYGAQLPDGCAGENILIESDHVWSLDELGPSLMIERVDGQLVALDKLMVAAPCVEFSRFAHLSAEPLTSEQLRATLQFLDGGMRGFYARLAEGQPDAEIRAGDRVFVG